jgi:hypothetical protein
MLNIITSLLCIAIMCIVDTQYDAHPTAIIWICMIIAVIHVVAYTIREDK